MKHFRSYLSFLLLSFFLLQSCEKDDSVNKEVHQHDSNRLDIQISIKSLDELENKQIIESNIEMIGENYFSNVTKSTIISDTTTFRYYRDKIQYIDYGHAETYTIKIERAFPEEPLENLVYYKDTTMLDYKLFLASYPLKLDSTSNIIEFKESPSKIIELSTDPLNVNFINFKCDRVGTTVFVNCFSNLHNEDNISDWPNCQKAGTPDGPSIFTTWLSDCNSGIQQDDPTTDLNSGNPVRGGGSVITSPLNLDACIGPSTIIGSGISTDLGNGSSGCMTISDMLIEIDNLLNVNLTIEEKSWILASSHNTENAHELYQLLKQNQDPNNDYAELAFRVALKTLIENFDEFSTVEDIDDAITEVLEVASSIAPVYMKYYWLEYTMYKIDNPNTKSHFIHFYAAIEVLHTQLDLLGTIPVAGEIADLTNGFIYTLQGDGVNATLSSSGAIPIAGWATAGVKMAKKIDRFNAILKFTIRTSDGLIDFGRRNSKKFRKVCGLVTGDPRQAHHLIPRAERFLDNDVIQSAAQKGFHIDEGLNGIPLAKNIHEGPHNDYSNKIFEVLEDFADNNPSFTPDDALTEVSRLTNLLKNVIESNPGVSLNNLIHLIN